MPTSSGSLLRAWRRASGRTQSELAAEVHVSSAAVSAWETGVRGIPLGALDRLDSVFGAGGCLVDLARAIGTSTLEPRTRWGHAFHGEPGPVWAWIRPVRAGRVRGLARLRVFGLRIDHEVGPEGLFMVAPWMDPNWAVNVLTDEPVWVDFGRGVPPAWLDVPRMSSIGLRDVVLSHPGDPMMGRLVDGVRRLDRGDPRTLRPRIRSLVDGDRWDALEHQWRSGAGSADWPMSDAHRDPTPPRTPDDHRSLHRQLRHARGLSQAEAAQAATRVLRTGDHMWPHPGSRRRGVSPMQVHNYEVGRTGRVRHLPAVLDMAYGGYGVSCFEPVRTAHLRPDVVMAHFPDYWLGPVTLVVRPEAAPAPAGPVTLSWRSRRREVALAGEPVRLCFSRFPEDCGLTVEVPSGWTVGAWMGYDPDAVELHTDWVPVSPEAEQVILQRVLASIRLALGISEDAFERALSGPAVNDPLHFPQHSAPHAVSR
ncbi:helix-turn-helix domain-containing protein [Intrasporangium mesophilum]